jgi:hypothetical protein
MRWRWLTMLTVAGWLGLGCGKTIYRSHEAQFCSTDDDDDPFYECSPARDLVCINTYAMQFSADGGSKSLPLYLCRLACTPGDICPNGETCCPGPISGRTYGKMHACVPDKFCDNPIVPDGGHDGRPDGRTFEAGREMGTEAGSEAGGEAGSGDGPADAPGGDGPDAGDPVDAPADPDAGAAG